MRRILATLLLLLVTTSLVCAQNKNRNRAWLNGTWEGTGYQIDNNEHVDHAAHRQGQSLPDRISIAQMRRQMATDKNYASTARFREILTSGADVCADNGRWLFND